MQFGEANPGGGVHELSMNWILRRGWPTCKLWKTRQLSIFGVRWTLNYFIVQRTPV
ncbi:hypothetical protein GCM10010525_20110 [Glutamicibacter bergerei]|uniref:Uncharacterized protein n=1 Tax=Glutamicibacter ardleyensis TaxID=225894 RepID=A0ABQ2D7A8_9MICC|nr:hypothetical protein GCM10007173_03890 [Glutamicibacter ardleyensis]